MTRSARNRDGLSPSLFPFLAVLLCTMGALVLILMLSVSGAQNTAHQLAIELEEEVEIEEAKLQMIKRGLAEKLEESKIQLEKKRLSLQHLEEHIRELTEELDQLLRQQELAEATKEAPNPLEDAERQELVSELEKQLAEATKELQQKLEDPTGDKPIFAIIPYDGPNGTHRRPIYLECTDKGVFIQPEGVLVSAADLRPPYGPGNPLDAALRAIRAEFPSRTGSVTSNPYPLLVVRPSGIKHYMMARAAMTGWDDQFGYELVSEDLDLAYPPSLPHLPGKITQALELARQRQAALVKAMPQHYSSVEAFSSELAYLSGGDSAGELSQGQDGDFSASGQSNSSAFSTASAGNSLGAQPAAFNIGAGESNFRSGMTGAQLSDSGQPGSQAALGQQFGSGAFGISSGESPSARELTHSGFGSSPGELGSWGSESSGDSMGGPAGSFGSNGSSFSGTGSFDANSSTAIGGDAGGSGSSSQSGGTGGNASGMAASSSASSMNSPLPGSFSQTGSPGSAMNSSASSSFSSPMGSPSGSSMGSPSMGNFDSSAGQSGGSCDQNCQSPPLDSHQSIPPNLNMNISRSQAELAKPVALARGANWAWDRPQRTQTAIVRAIRIRCYVDRWEIMPEKGSSKPPVTIGFDGSPTERAEKLATEVRKRVESWGVALAGGHWTPVLHVDVAADADWRFTQLQRLMEGSGIDVQRKETIR